ncbi:MFS transporter [Asaia prunellae]|uniref:MFS transporter n=1 Tax=Asaia prunellae TaxID=610245 RepID=UPI00046FD7BE|nr:MFS transporter [Asaia prunellae]
MAAGQGNGLRSPIGRILPVVSLNLIIYIVIGLPMAVIPIFVHNVLHCNTVIAGFAVSLQYFATFASRASAGRRIDTRGPKPVAVLGLALGIGSGVLLLVSGLTRSFIPLSLLCLFISRLALGWAESWASTAAIVWNIRRVGAANTAQVISWNGITSYGGIALGATIGEKFSHFAGGWGGLVTLGIVSIFLPVLGTVLASSYPAVAPIRHDKPAMPFAKVFMLVLPHGCALAAGSVGFGVISSCLALYFAAEHWPDAAQALAVFGIVFVIIRFVFARQIGRIGGTNVAIISLAVETAGLLILAFLPSPAAATLGAAVTGAGFSLVFPALGVLAVDRAGAENRGAALGAFSVFLDLAIGISGPLLGLVIHSAGYMTLFIFTACITSLGIAQVMRLRRATRA